MQPEITHVIAALIANPPGGARCISVKEAVKVAVATQPRSYGLTTEYALRRYRALKRGSIRMVSPQTKALWDELSSRVDSRMERHPEEDDFMAIDHILSYEAPSRYYITPLYAEKLFYRRRRKARSRSPRT